MKFSLKRNERCCPGVAWCLNEIPHRVKYVCQEPREKVTAFCQMKGSTVRLAAVCPFLLWVSTGLTFSIWSFCLTTPPPSLSNSLTYRMSNARKSSSSCGMYCPRRDFCQLIWKSHRMLLNVLPWIKVLSFTCLFVLTFCFIFLEWTRL